MTFNIYGLAFVLFLVLLAIFARWVFGENLKIKYTKIKTDKNQAAIFILKNELVQFDPKWTLKPKSSFLSNQISLKGSYMGVPKNLDNNSIYAFVNAFYLLNKFLYSNKIHFKIENIIKWVQFILFINFSWTIIFNFKIVSFIFASFFVLNVLLDTIFSFSKSKIWFQKTQLLLGKELNNKDYLICKKYLKYKKYFWLYKHLIVFFEPFFLFAKVFMEWGKYD